MNQSKSYAFALLFLFFVNGSDFRQRLELVMPFLQASALAVTFVNNSLQIAKVFRKSEKS